MSDLQVSYDGRSYRFQPGQTVRIGRSTDNDVVVSDPTVSRRHAQITWSAESWVWEGLGRAGTFVGGTLVTRMVLTGLTDVSLASPGGPLLRLWPQPGPEPAVTRGAESYLAGGQPPAAAAMPGEAVAGAGPSGGAGGVPGAAPGGAGPSGGAGGVPGAAPGGAGPSGGAGGVPGAAPGGVPAAAPASGSGEPSGGTAPDGPGGAGSGFAEGPAAHGPRGAGSGGPAAGGYGQAAAPGNGFAAGSPAGPGTGNAAGQGEVPAGGSAAGPRGGGFVPGVTAGPGTGFAGPGGGFPPGAGAGYPPGATPGMAGAARRLTPPADDLATAFQILVPVRTWLSDPGWRQGVRLLVIPYALLPLVFLALFGSSGNLSTPGWAYSLYIAPLWAIAFWLLIRPGPVTRLELLTGAGIIAWVLIWMSAVTININDHLNHNSFAAALGVGFNEEITKALPILAAALLLQRLRSVKLDVRMWLFLGTIAGLTFGVRESSLYTTLAIKNIAAAAVVHSANLAVVGALSFAYRVFVDGFQHAIWAGVSAFFIGMAVNYPRRRIQLIAFGISIAALLHALNDWLLSSVNSLWPWIALQAVSLFLFLGYTMSATSIERRVRRTPMFRGDSMLMERFTESGDVAGQ
jgi:RsiW-degrading membrane proteinase PrsW (M82 family)